MVGVAGKSFLDSRDRLLCMRLCVAEVRQPILPAATG
jgi:hypothetical protein